MKRIYCRRSRSSFASLVDNHNPRQEMPKFNPINTHCETSGGSLTEQDPYNIIIRTTVEATASLFLQLKTGIPKVVDPWAGSYFMESLTPALARKAMGIIEEVDHRRGDFRRDGECLGET